MFSYVINFITSPGPFFLWCDICADLPVMNHDQTSVGKCEILQFSRDHRNTGGRLYTCSNTIEDI